jgi:hypothetical protein
MATRHVTAAAVSVVFCLIGAVCECRAESARNLLPRPYFERNAGQAAADVRFVMRGPALTGAVTARGIAIDAPDGRPRLLRFEGATLARAQAEDAMPGRVHYLVGPEHGWRRDIGTYGRVRSSDLYPGVDIVIYGAGDGFEYDLVIAPGADPRKIAFALENSGAPRFRGDGSLAWTFGGLDLVHGRPVAYQAVNGGRRHVDVRYRVTRSGVVRFEIGSYDRSQPLVIDPTLGFSSRFPGPIADIAFDTAGNLYLFGTPGPGFTATPGAYQASVRGMFVAKLDPDTRTLLYATYLGGNQRTAAPIAIAVDGSGNAYLTGWTDAPDYPTTADAPDRTCGDGSCVVNVGGFLRAFHDAFVTKLNAAGSALVYSTYLGGLDEERARDIGVDSAGRAHIVGETSSDDFPATAGAFSACAGRESDGFMTTVNASGTAWAYSTCIGGTSFESAWAIAVAPDGARIVTGNTGSVDFPTVAPAQPALAGGSVDGFVVKFGAAAIVQYSTYAGGDGWDIPASIDFASDGSVWVGGVTRSSSLPGTNLQFGTRDADTGDDEAMLFHLSADGQRLTDSLTIAGFDDDGVTAVAVDSRGVVHFTGHSDSDALPATIDAVQRSNANRYRHDVIYGSYVPGAARLAYLTFLGGGSNDIALTLALDASGRTWIAGDSSSTNFPLRDARWTSGAGFLARFDPDRSPGSGAAEIVLHAHRASVHGAWRVEADPTAAGGRKARHPDAGAARLPIAAAPVNYFDLTFTADAGVPYRLWVRGKADANAWFNDSVHVQFSNSVDGAGAAVWRIGSATATTVQVERCTSCGLRGWGWNDNGYGAAGDNGALGPPVRFATGGTQTIRVQTREDGLAIDQIVLSASRYFTTPPGAAKDDTTVLAEGSGGGGGGTCSAGEVVLHGVDAAVHGGWAKLTDSTAASSTRAIDADAGAPRVAAPLAAPVNYIELTFFAEANVDHRLWIRGRAVANHWANDSAYVQFSDSITASGGPLWRIGTTSGTRYQLEDCDGCGVSAWGWNDNAGVALGTPVRFATTGMHTIRIQTREDGLSIDQIVLSAERFLTTPPGPLKNDATILDKCSRPATSTTP